MMIAKMYGIKNVLVEENSPELLTSVLYFLSIAV